MSDLKPGHYAVFDTTLGEITCELFPRQGAGDGAELCGAREWNEGICGPQDS